MTGILDYKITGHAHWFCSKIGNKWHNHKQHSATKPFGYTTKQETMENTISL